MQFVLLIKITATEEYRNVINKPYNSLNRDPSLHSSPRCYRALLMSDL